MGFSCGHVCVCFFFSFGVTVCLGSDFNDPSNHLSVSAHGIINTALQEQKAPVVLQPPPSQWRDGGAVECWGGTNGKLQPMRYLHAHAGLSCNLFALKLAHKVG